MSDKISPIKERILYFIENQGITKKDFCDKTKISYANMRGKSLLSEIGGEQLSEILSQYSEISPDWLVTGRGEMLRNNDTIQSISGNSNIQISGNENMAISHRDLEDKITYLEDKVLFLTEQIKAKDSQINTLLSIIQKNK